MVIVKCNKMGIGHLCSVVPRHLLEFSVMYNIVAANISLRKYSPRGAHSMITKRNFVFRGSYLCENYRNDP